MIVSPAAPVPRKDAKRRSRLVEEHRRRAGDPQEGGGSRKPVMTAYRQRALACANGASPGAAADAGAARRVPDATKIVYDNVYGWFAPLSRGVYELTAAGRAALEFWARRTEGRFRPFLGACAAKALLCVVRQPDADIFETRAAARPPAA